MNPSFPENSTLRQEEKFLTESACKGNTQAFAALYDRYAPALLGWMKEKVTEQKKTEEILERSFVQLWQEMQVPGFVADRVYLRLMAIVRELFKKEGLGQETKNIQPGVNLKALELVYFKGCNGAQAATQLGLTQAELKTTLRAELSVYRKNKK